MNKKSIFSTLILTLMVFGALFVANLSPYIKVSAEQTKVTLVSGTKYMDLNGNYYEKATTLTSNIYNDGTSFSSGEIAYFKYEPIVWQVLEYDSSGRALVFSNKALAHMALQPTYNSNYYTGANGGDETVTWMNNYTYSNIRYWLNGYTQINQKSDATKIYGSSFYDSAFSTDEQNKILATSGIGVDDETTYVAGTFNDSTNSSTAQPISTADKIFVLSEKDVTNTAYFADNVSRKRTITDYVASQGAYREYIAGTGTLDNQGYNTNYWLRTPNSSVNFGSQFVNISAVATCSSYQSTFCVVPAMYLNTSGLTFYTTADCTTITSAAAKTCIKFGSYPQTVASSDFKEVVINIPDAGVSINTAGIVLSGTILLGLMTGLGVWLVAQRKQKARR